MKIRRTLETNRYEIQCRVTYKLTIDGTDEEVDEYLARKAFEKTPVHKYMEVADITPVEIDVYAIDERD